MKKDKNNKIKLMVKWMEANIVYAVSGDTSIKLYEQIYLPQLFNKNIFEGLKGEFNKIKSKLKKEFPDTNDNNIRIIIFDDSYELGAYVGVIKDNININKPQFKIK